MLTFSMLFNLVIASGTIGVLVYAVHAIVKKQVSPVSMLVALSFVLYELVATQYLFPHIGLSVAVKYGYFSREANIIGLPFYLGILLIGYGLFTTVALGKKALICSRLDFKQSIILIAILVGLAHPAVGVVVIWAAIGCVLVFGATAIGYLVNVMLSFLLYLYKNASRRHDIACGDGEVCSSPFPLLPLVDIGSFTVVGRSFIFGAAALMPIVFWALHCDPIMLNILIFFAMFASTIMIAKYDMEDGAFHISTVLGVAIFAFGFLALIFDAIDDPIPDEKKLNLYGMIATGLLLFLSGTINDKAEKPEIDRMLENSKRLATEVARINSESSSSAEYKRVTCKKKYPSGR